MPAQILSVERERALKEARTAINARQPAADILSVERERTTRLKLRASEQRLQALAAAERARREEAAAQKRAAAPKAKRIAPIHAERPPTSLLPSAPPAKGVCFASDRPPSACNEPASEAGACTVVAVHADGRVDLQLPTGEIAERVHPSELARPSSAASDRPPSSASSGAPLVQPSTAPRHAALMLAGLKHEHKALKSESTRLEEERALLDLRRENRILQAEIDAQTQPTKAPAPLEDGADEVRTADLAVVEAQVSRKGGRRTVSAARAAQCEVAALLSWE
jgi:hypothetical protein